MTCRRAEHLVVPYISGSITDRELKEFLKYTETCEECREELEIYSIMDVDIHQLNQGTGIYNIREALETVLEPSRQKVHTLGIPETTCHAVSTLCF